jgi:iron complex transport system ATP-binding protein
VLKGITFALEPRTITAICGPNGAGKSTLLSALAGLVKPDAGDALLDGDGVFSLHPRERAKRLGYLPQDGEVAWDLSVRSLVALGRLPHRDTHDAAIDSAISDCGLGELATRPVSTLSGGEKARALLARVLAGEPKWILADEPLAALDLGHQLALLDRLRAAAKGGAGVVLVLHDLPLAMNHADRVLVLDDGTIAAEGAPESALSEAVIAEVWNVTARWLGEPGTRALAVG